MMHLYLIRHGETIENVTGILQGHLPGTLSENGRWQARNLENEFASKLKPDFLYCSDLSRAVETASLLNADWQLPLFQSALLRERDWGELTGLPISQIPPGPFPESVETIDAMLRRAGLFLRQLYSTIGLDNQKVVVVSHGLFCRCLQSVTEGVPFRDVPRFQNAEVRHVVFSRPFSAQSSAKDDVEESSLAGSES